MPRHYGNKTKPLGAMPFVGAKGKKMRRYKTAKKRFPNKPLTPKDIQTANRPFNRLGNSGSSAVFNQAKNWKP